MKSIFSWVSLITGVLPGIAVILNGFGTPEELRKPFGIMAAVCGFIAFGVIAFIRESVRRGNRKVLAGIVIAFGLIGLFSLCSYWSILDQCVFYSPKRSAVFFPLWLNGQAKEDINSAGGPKAFYEKYGAGAVSALLESQSDALNRTKWLLLVLILAASVALPVASGLSSALPDRCSTRGTSPDAKTQVPQEGSKKKAASTRRASSKEQ